MSGIAGIFLLDDRPVGPADLRRMVDSLAHRGPDGSGLWHRGAIGVGHRMLWTTPESLHEQLPLTDKSGNFVITADARIDNRDELISALDLTDIPRAEITDSALILRAYEKWGEDCPSRLLGDFAFVIGDERRHTLFCARDHFGVKPFYYYRSDRAFLFASEIKALLTQPDVPRRLNETRVADYLVPMFEDQTITFYQDIVRLPPGHTMSVRPGGGEVRRYWALDPTRELRLASSDEYADAFRELFTDSVRRRLRSTSPVGSLLSGGLDSSSIVCVARELRAQTHSESLRTFSAVFDTVPKSDERPFINAVLAQNGVVPNMVHADRISPLYEVERMFWHQDEPFWNPQMYVHWGLHGAANEKGVRILLDGFVGDAVISHGISYLTELARAGRCMRLVRELWTISNRFQASPATMFKRHVIKPLLPAAARKTWRALRRRTERPPTVNAAFAHRIGLTERFRSQSLNGERLGWVTSARRDHWVELTSGIYPFALEVIDKAAAAFRLEARYPFLDRRLVEFCLAIPAAEKLRHGWPRSILRRALQDVLPAEVAWRTTKGNLSFNFTRALKTFERSRLDELILAPHAAVQAYGAYVDVEALRAAYRRFLATESHDDAITIWKAATLVMWLDHTRLSA